LHSKQQDGAQEGIIKFLSDPASYPGKVHSVDTIATHASLVFLAGEFAYKLKRAVRYSYLDYSTPELRRQACEAELALNRRTAPTLYLAVRPIRRTAAGLSFDGPGEPEDWVVVMRRFPQDALFSHLADHGMLTDQLALDLADRIAAFHATASVEPDRGGTDGIAAVIRINDENLRRSPPRGATVVDVDRLRDASGAALQTYATLLESRRTTGRVRRCHGDLHLGNICLVDGQPTLFDCIEFSDLIACIDVLYDLAFLLMDLRHRSLRQLCSRVFNRYIDLSGDDEGVPALPLFMSLRAAVRAHVMAAAAKSSEISAARHQQLVAAKSYLGLATELLQPQRPRLLAIGGLSGTGKSTIAAAIAGDLGVGPGARILRSDVLRKQLFGQAPEQRLPGTAYSTAVNKTVYTTLETRAAALLAAGYSVIIDAVAAKPEERTAMADLARKAGAAFTGVWLEAPAATLLARIESRSKDASDATKVVLSRQLAYDLGEIDWVRLDVNRTTDEVVRDVWRVLRA
jgi:hypothetical protein